jgi:hypothetical protein
MDSKSPLAWLQPSPRHPGVGDPLALWRGPRLGGIIPSLQGFTKLFQSLCYWCLAIHGTSLCQNLLPHNNPG